MTPNRSFSCKEHEEINNSDNGYRRNASDLSAMLCDIFYLSYLFFMNPVSLTGICSLSRTYEAMKIVQRVLEIIIIPILRQRRASGAKCTKYRSYRPYIG
jgi:hypothetical protein